MFSYEYEEREDGEKRMPVAGKARFTIKRVYDKDREGNPLKVASTGMPKIKLEYSVVDSKGGSGVVYETLTQKTGWKIKELGEAVGHPEIFNKNGLFDPHFLVGKQGECMIKVENTGYGDQAKVDKYLPCGLLTEQRPLAKEEFDDLPF